MAKKAFIYISLILVCIAILYIAFTFRNPKEGFTVTKKAVDESPYKKFTRDDYVSESKNKYNRFADMIDARNTPFYGLNSEAKRVGAAKSILDATSTSDPTGSTNLGTFNIDILKTRLEPPRQNRLITDAMVCENVKTRKACSSLGDPGFNKCGVCIKNGDSITYDNKNHIGGMLLLPSDRNAQIDAAGGADPVFKPTGGKCPEGNFYVEKEECEKAVNRIECKEIGERGGWDGTTIEGLKVADEKCAQVIKQENSFIYEPKGRKFNITLRVLTPSGTGICKVWIYDAGGKQLAFNEGLPGVEFLVVVKNVQEYQTLSVVIAEEVAYRLHGKSELFGIETGGYNQTKESAEKLCQRIGTQLATMDQMTDAIQNGAQVCMSGWGQDFCGYPGQASLASSGGCGGKGFNNWCYSNPDNKITYAATYCYGVKPPRSKNELMHVGIADWFYSFGKDSRPSQEDQPTLFSRYGMDYIAPSLRAVLLQWEIDSTVPENINTSRVVNFEPTIMAVNDQAPNNISSDGSKTFKVLRKFGTFGASKDIVSPRPTASDKMLTNQFWLWGNDSKVQQVKFEIKVPSVFAPSFYQEDREISNDGPLVSNRESLKLLRSSPCFNTDQKPGNYSVACLKTLFIAAGGDINNGKLATAGLGLSKLNGLGSVDDISDFLTDTYNIAVTGKDTDGKKVGSNPAEHKKLINEASQSFFGFDLCTPCEDVGEDRNGDIVFIPKAGDLDETCLDWLWMNTGRTTNREEGSGPNRIAPTYTAIGQRFSGLKEGEASQATLEKYPFQTCQRNGTLAPINSQGVTNPGNVAKANTKRTVQGVQEWYNSIFQTANNKVTTKLQEKPQMEAVAQCYGVNKIVDKKCSATFYSDYNFGGQSGTLEEGTYDFPSFIKVVPNDTTSSIKVDPGCKALVFAENMNGGVVAVTADIPDLRSFYLDKMISSAVISKANDGSGNM